MERFKRKTFILLTTILPKRISIFQLIKIKKRKFNKWLVKIKFNYNNNLSLIKSLNKNYERIYYTKFSPDGNLLGSFSENQLVLIFETNTLNSKTFGELKFKIKCANIFPSFNKFFDFSPSNSEIVICSRELYVVFNLIDINITKTINSNKTINENNSNKTSTLTNDINKKLTMDNNHQDNSINNYNNKNKSNVIILKKPDFSRKFLWNLSNAIQIKMACFSPSGKEFLILNSNCLIVVGYDKENKSTNNK